LGHNERKQQQATVRKDLLTMADTAAKEALSSSHEAAFLVKIARMASEKKVIVSESPIALTDTVKSPLIEPMFKTYIGTLSGVFVVLAGSGMGKTEAAMYFMKSLRPQSPDRGIMVGGASHQRYGRKLATKLKAPPSKTDSFAQTLSAALSSTVPERRNVSLLNRLLDGIGECYGSQSILEEGVDVTLVEDRVGDLNLEEQGRRLLPTGEAPVLILDDFKRTVLKIEVSFTNLRSKLA
jgi:hypothetical protein